MILMTLIVLILGVTLIALSERGFSKHSMTLE